MRRRLVGGLVTVVVAALVMGWFVRRDDAGEPPSDRALGAEVDENGCVLGVYANTDFRLDPDDGGSLTVCHFEMQPLGDEPAHLLDWSRELTEDESAAVRAAIRAAPRGEQEFTGCDVAAEDGPGEFFLLFTEGHGSVPFWVHNAACGDNGVLAVDARGELVHRLDTAEVLEVLGSAYGPLGPPTGQ